ncbi:proteasome adapter and scaffold protein ECM29 [Agrilus planipennis]|uniref:Proteasome adapter and scaffold protein ECM29 n=1 Tax=Agrilus planipennis TaxID=224129 RepID=A0A1W4WAW0_AGRPL|nr:proteasome adapter and scaffold protein ECM29 [Agrilus planipennis]
MAGAADELVLLERVFLRVGSAETDEQLQNAVSKFLPPVLLKLSSQQEGVRKKVMELLVHINKRIKSRPSVQLPVESLLVQYQDPVATSFVTNFTIIYLKLGFPRLPVDKQLELVPSVLNAIDLKPQSHQDSLLLLIIPLLGKTEVPTDPAKRASLYGLNEKQQVSKHLLGLLLDMLLLPYGALAPQKSSEEQNSSNDISLPVPPGMSEYSFKRVTVDNPMKPEELEEIKVGIVKFLAHGIFPDDEILIHLVVAAADTRFTVANLADLELKKVIGSVDWSSPLLPMPLYLLFLGSQSQNVKPNMKKSPATTRIRLKLLTYLGRVTGTGFVLPASIQVIFDSLYGTNTNAKLKTLALNFATNLVRSAEEASLCKVAAILMSGLLKLIREGEPSHQSQAFIIIGMIGRRFPSVVYHDVGLLEMFFKNLETANPDLKLQIREGLLNLILAYKYDVNPKEADKDGRMNILFVLVKYFANSEEPMVRFAAVRSVATIFPPNHVPSKFLLLMSTGDNKDDVSMEAFKALYGTGRKNEIDLTKARKTNGGNRPVLPPFDEITKYVYNEVESRVKDTSKCVHIANYILPFTSAVFTEMIIYLRLCLLQNLDIPLTREILRHPNEYSPKIRSYLEELYNDNDTVEKSPLIQYVTLIRQLLIANIAIEPLSCMVEIIGCLPQLHKILLYERQWIRDQLNSTKEEIRDSISILYAIIVNESFDDDKFEEELNFFVSQTSSKNLEVQHGAILALSNLLERRITTKRTPKDLLKWELFKESVQKIVHFFRYQNPLLLSAASTGIGLIGRSIALPLEDGKNNTSDSPDAKRPTNSKTTKFSVVSCLLDVMNNVKNPAKLRESAARSLGLLCVGENFPHTQYVIDGLLNTAKETKDVEVHFTVGESLVMCVQSIWSPEARDYWSILPEDHTPVDTMCEQPSDETLTDLLNKLINMASQTHPNVRQASCIWLLALIKRCDQRVPLKEKLTVIQKIFMEFLGENNDIVQDVASKGICLIYDISKSEELLNSLVDQLMMGRRQAMQVTSDTKLFEEGQLGKTPTGGNLTTYKELCALASDLNKPDLIYQFMNLANHNAIWNSKKGAAFGFSSLAEKCGEHLKPHLPKIIPKLYRYQFDPNPNIQASMQNIWHVLVPETQKTLELYHNDILDDLMLNMNSSQFRVRQSCCLALQDVLKGAGNKSIHDCVDRLEELWTKLFRVMDDHHEATRLIANKTARVFSKLCIRGCDLNQGKAGVRMVQAVLPVMLNQGITSCVAEVRTVSLQTVSELVGAAGNQLKPFLVQLIPALLQATGELESSKLSYLSTYLGGNREIQEEVDSVRATFAKSHFTTETVTKCLQYVDSSILEELTPKITELMKGSSSLGSRIACAHFITLLVVQVGHDLQPYAGKFLASLVNGLTDRNAAIRKHYAVAIGHLVSRAKDSSIEKLLAKIKHWYFEREDNSIRSACAYTIQSIGNHNQEILKQYSNEILPLVFFAMHAEKTEETETTIETWNDIWSENSPGMESGIKQNIEEICMILKTGLESPSWTMKAQAANAVSTVANKLGTSMGAQHRNSLIQILLTGLNGRTWNGKQKLMNALASICTSCKDSLKNDQNFDPQPMVEAIIKESRKDEVTYKTHALRALGDILSSLQIDKFEEVYNITQTLLICEDSVSSSSSSSSANKDKDEEEMAANRDNNIKVKEVAYEVLGKAWPQNSNAGTQEKYRELFAKHCVDCLPYNTRSVQVCVMAALREFVEKLDLLGKDKLTTEEEEALERILENVLKAVTFSFG